jgi:hypothetical protein
MSRLGDSMDLPYEDNPPGQFIEDVFSVSGGVVVAGAWLPVDGENKPALVFRFSNPLGQFLTPILLVLDDDQAAKLPDLIKKAVSGAIKAAREAA